MNLKTPSDDLIAAATASLALLNNLTRCTYPRCKCIVSTSTTNPEPVCPKGLPK